MDRAGNVGCACSPEALKVDMARPKGTILGVDLDRKAEPKAEAPAAKAAPAPAPAPAPAKPAGGGFVLQVGAYKSQADAQTAWAEYKRRHSALPASRTW